MTNRKKLILIALAMTNLLIISALILVVLRPVVAPPMAVSTPAGSEYYPLCEWQAAQRMAAAQLSGSVRITNDHILHFDITHRLRDDQSGEDAAQLIWLAFDIAQSLQESEACNVFTQVDITISTHNNNAQQTHITGSVSAADLAKFSAGELSEEAFIDRVMYTIDP